MSDKPAINGYDEDFLKVIERANSHTLNAEAVRGVPLSHPPLVSDSEHDKIVQEAINARMPPKQIKYRAKYMCLDLSDTTAQDEMNELTTNCLQKGWIQAREEWKMTEDGKALCMVKFLIPDGEV